MVEPIMYMAIGFLVSMLLGLMVLPLVHNRAVRLTTRRLEAAAPVSMAEIQADKDQLRAEFAVAARRLEMNVEQLKSKTTSQFAELGKKTDAINRMKLELGEKNAAIFSLEARESAVKDQLRVTTEEFGAKTEALQSAEQALADKHAELARLSAELSDRSQTAESRQTELTAVHGQIDLLTTRVGEAEREFAATQQRLDQHRIEAATAGAELAQARGRVENLSQRVSDLDGQLIAQVKEAESLGNRADELQSQLAAQGKLLAEREDENTRLRKARETAETTVKELRDEVFALSKGNASPMLAKLQAESSSSSEHAENALLRERINDIAAEVAKLTMTLEGPDSPIGAILAADPAGTAKPARSGAANGQAAALQGTLADRIRALQSHASRAARQPG